jgi:hypothetical protein
VHVHAPGTGSSACRRSGQCRGRAALELALAPIEEAAGGRVKGLIGNSDPVRAVREAIGAEPFEEGIVSTLPQRVSHWLHHDVPARVERLGVRVTVVTARESERAVWEDIRLFGDP